MGKDPAGRAMLAGGLTLLAIWLAIATATTWLLFRRADHGVHPAWLWAGGVLTVLGGIVLGILFVQTVLSLGGQRERAYHDYLEGLRADERRRAADETPSP